VEINQGTTPERYRRIVAIFEAACEHPTERRAGFLVEACAGDEALRREVEEMLAHDASGGGKILDRPAAELVKNSTRSARVGSQLGPYRIEAVIGEGGMGVVYKALDVKLNRPAAIKFLHDDLADVAARRRFQREAKMASSLNHPHIVTVYDAGEFDGQQYLITEFVDGGTLQDWAKTERRSWRQIVELLVGVADALSSAHAVGMTHRDIKPANILVAKNGYAKLADFGLAKLAEIAAPEQETRTLTDRVTRPGVIVGTIAYMSPEQASSKSVDARSDIFSFGVVMYELLAGRRPFAGATDLELLQNIIHGAAQPLSEEIPTELRLVVGKTLEKDPADRYQAMREMVVDLRRFARQSGETKRVPLRRRRWGWAVLVPVLVLTGFFVWQALRAPESTAPLRAVPLNSLPGVERYPSFSPDGSYVAFTWTGPKQNNPDIYVQQIGSTSLLRLTTDPGNDYNPVWSPDGRWIAFLRRQWQAGTSELRLIAPLGGPERKLAEIRVRESVNPPYLAWCPDSDCLLVTDSPGEGKPGALFVVSLETGEKRQLTNPQPPAGDDTNPAISPDGQWLIFRRTAHGPYLGELYRLAMERGTTPAGEPRRLTPSPLDAGYPTWIPASKSILFSAQGSLWRLAVAGENTPARLPYVGEDGMMPVISHPQPDRPARLLYVRSFQDFNIWRIETSAPGATASSPPVIAISSTRRDGDPDFSPDGRRVALWSDRSGQQEIWLSDSDGSNAVQLTAIANASMGVPRWSPDGERIVFGSNFEGQADVYVIPATGGKPRNLTAHPATDFYPSFSNDGKWIYFMSDRTGTFQIWKMPASGGNAIQLTDNGGSRALESPDGAFVYYTQTMDKPSDLWRVPASGGHSVKVLDGVLRGAFAVMKDGIYYIDQLTAEGAVGYIDQPAGETRLQYFDFANRRSTIVARKLGKVGAFLTASQDGRTILFTRMDSSVDDLMLVDNFR